MISYNTPQWQLMINTNIGPVLLSLNSNNDFVLTFLCSNIPHGLRCLNIFETYNYVNFSQTMENTHCWFNLKLKFTCQFDTNIKYIYINIQGITILTNDGDIYRTPMTNIIDSPTISYTKINVPEPIQLLQTIDNHNSLGVLSKSGKFYILCVNLYSNICRLDIIPFVSKFKFKDFIDNGIFLTTDGKLKMMIGGSRMYRRFHSNSDEHRCYYDEKFLININCEFVESTCDNLCLDIYGNLYHLKIIRLMPKIVFSELVMSDVRFYCKYGDSRLHIIVDKFDQFHSFNTNSPAESSDTVKTCTTLLSCQPITNISKISTLPDGFVIFSDQIYLCKLSNDKTTIQIVAEFTYNSPTDWQNIYNRKKAISN